MATIPRVISVSAVAGCASQDPSAGQGIPPESFEDQRCNGTLRKQASPRPLQATQGPGLAPGLGTGPGALDDSSGQRYSADPTLLLGERGPKGDTDQDGYMTAMREKNNSGSRLRNIHLPHRRRSQAA